MDGTPCLYLIDGKRGAKGKDSAYLLKRPVSENIVKCSPLSTNSMQGLVSKQKHLAWTNEWTVSGN